MTPLFATRSRASGVRANSPVPRDRRAKMRNVSPSAGQESMNDSIPAQDRGPTKTCMPADEPADAAPAGRALLVRQQLAMPLEALANNVREVPSPRGPLPRRRRADQGHLHSANCRPQPRGIRPFRRHQGERRRTPYASTLAMSTPSFSPRRSCGSAASSPGDHTSRRERVAGSPFHDAPPAFDVEPRRRRPGT